VRVLSGSPPAFPMQRAVPLFLLVVVIVAAAGRPAVAQTTNATLNASVNGLARLSLSSAAISFPDADPDAVPSIQATPGAISLTAKARTGLGGTVTLTVQASGQLRSGIDTIPASSITWVTTGVGFSSGTLSAAAPQVVGSWTGSGVQTGTQTFFFRNLWSYATGTYTLTMTYTLSAA
jgi:hypothetical protein